MTTGDGDWEKELEGWHSWSTGDILHFERHRDDAEIIDAEIIEEEVPTECLSVSGHPDEYYNGQYCKASFLNGQTSYNNLKNQAYFYNPSDFWQFDFRAQDGSRNFHEGG